MTLATQTAREAQQPDPLLILGDRLLDPADRQSYAALVLWMRSLPPRDEMVKLAELLGFLTVMGHELPAALTAQINQFDALQERLNTLPDEITNGLDPGEFAEAMRERFRQQLATTGLEETARLLAASTATLRRLSGDLADTLKPVTNQYTSIGTTVSGELTKLIEASAQLRQHNANLVAQAAEDHWLSKTLFCFLLFCAGLIIGFSMEKRRTTDAIYDLQGQTAQILQKLTAPPSTTQTSTASPKTGARGRIERGPSMQKHTAAPPDRTTSDEPLSIGKGREE